MADSQSLFVPDLIALQQALDTNDDDIETIMPFIKSISKFANHDRSTALTLLQTTFWSEIANNSFSFSSKFKLLNAQNLSIIIKQIGTPKLQSFLFKEQLQKYLSHYPMNDLITLLSQFYSDQFANFVFNAFKGFLDASLSLRIKYFQAISVKAMIMILKEGGVGKSLSNDELIIISIKMKEFLQSFTQSINISDEIYLDCKRILPEIIELVISLNNIKTLTIKHLETLLFNDLISNMQQAKNIMSELIIRQKKSTQCKISQINAGIDATNCDKLIGILSTDNFASFQRKDTSSNAHIILDGPLVIMPLDKSKNVKQSNKECVNYSVLVQIQDLNPLFNNATNTTTTIMQPKGSIFIVLLQQIPKNYEVVVFVSNCFDGNGNMKDLNIGIKNENPVVIIPWPLPKIGRAVSFRIHCQLRPRQKDVNCIKYGINQLSMTNAQQQKQQENDQNNTNSNIHMNLNGNNNQMAMCIYSGQKTMQNNKNRLAWINVIIHSKMTFFQMIDAACAQLGLSPPASENEMKDNSNQNVSFFASLSPSSSESVCYVVRNQMGYKCKMDENVIKYLNKSVTNCNLFPVFIFEKDLTNKQQQKKQQQQSGFLNFNSGNGQNNTFNSWGLK